MTGPDGGHEAKYKKMDFFILDILGKNNFCIEDLDSDICFQAEETFLDLQQALDVPLYCWLIHPHHRLRNEIGICTLA